MKEGKQKPVLKESEWAFHKVSPEELAACLWHERARGFGRGPVMTWAQKPWRDLESKKRRFLASLHPSVHYREPAVWPADPESVTDAIQQYGLRLAKRRDPLWKSPVEILRLDWRSSNAKLIRDFKSFLRDERRKPLSAAAEYKRIARTAGTGRPRDVKRCLVDLAIVRADAAGFRRQGIVKLLTPLLQKFEFLGQDGDVGEGLFSEKNWPTTLREAKGMIHP